MSEEKLWGKVRGEVNKILKKHGIGRKHEKRELMDENGADIDVLEPETLSSVRYELVKLQQELMRRKVLDPRHYAALSVDTLVPHRDKETQDMNIKTRFSDRGFMESKAAAAPSKVRPLPPSRPSRSQPPSPHTPRLPPLACVYCLCSSRS
jgi:hypothetical protein